MRPVELPPRVEFTLENGLRVVAAQRRELPLVSLLFVTDAGSSRDPFGKAGLASLASELLLRGTKKRAPGEVTRAIEAVGGRIDAAADRDRAYVSVQALAEHLPLALEIVADVVSSPLFDPRETEAARRRQVAELEQSKDDPAAVARRNLLAAYLPPDHPYAAPVPGWTSSVSRIGRADLVDFHRTSVAPQTSFLVVVGDVDADEVRRLAENCFGDWKGSGHGGHLPPFPRRTRPKVRAIHKEESTQTQVRMVGPAELRWKDPIFFPAMVANVAFGGGFTSRLVNEIRVNRGLTYSVGTAFALLRGGGFFSFSSFTKNETVGELLSVLLQESRRARENGFEPDEIERAKRYLAGLYPLGLETNEQVAAAIAETILFDLGEDWVPRYRERVMAVTPMQAAEAAARFFFADPFALVLVGDRDAIRRGIEDAGIDAEIEDLPLDEAA